MDAVDLPPLSDEDRAYLKRSVSDLSDICPHQLARIQAGFRHAYQVAQEIRDGLWNPLS